MRTPPASNRSGPPHARRSAPWLLAAPLLIACAAAVAPATAAPHGPLIADRRVEAGDLSVGYADLGPAEGRVVILLQSWPYDIDSYAEVAPALAARGYRVIVPYLRGHGSTRFLSPDTPRNGEQAALATDLVALMDALGIEHATLAGYDWGARSADIVAALWPERVDALVSVSGYLIGSQAAGRRPLPPAAELQWWYQYYFATDRGRDGYARYTHDFARQIWQLASPRWAFDDATFARSAAALENPDHVAVVVHNYRWRLGLADGEAKYAALEARLAQAPTIHVPTITIEGDANGAPHPLPESYAGKFTGRYEHRLFSGGVGHNPPQEDPAAFVEAVVDASRLAGPTREHGP
ncbi:alpha/beta fold hydrolase [Coralloluteibacterium stylophorae]|uniref:Alpha/beta hydrolase n=1 Tax=Coralloluteibacterium stylophorae TaxID=1776034 RepID=A0A8J8AXN6_9GAMM|nr:alpha/beta hydrolase [Coralloluteibacterium stylophorae]MBS7455780.1 alpha/beta hydrolase [Coralloluteibacterium stylophorae]